jgi:hypothetical protein
MRSKRFVDFLQGFLFLFLFLFLFYQRCQSPNTSDGPNLPPCSAGGRSSRGRRRLCGHFLFARFQLLVERSLVSLSSCISDSSLVFRVLFQTLPRIKHAHRPSMCAGTALQAVYPTCELVRWAEGSRLGLKLSASFRPLFVSHFVVLVKSPRRHPQLCFATYVHFPVLARCSAATQPF